jgi:hypothetical protein
MMALDSKVGAVLLFVDRSQAVWRGTKTKEQITYLPVHSAESD